MSAQASSNESLVLSYLGLRTAVGAIGIALPFVLALGKMLFESPGLQNSISDYYYTGMRNIFVGSLCAIGVFMLSYHGYDRGDDIGGDFAGLFAIGVALCPTTPEVDVRSYDRILGILHLVFAGGFLLTLAYFSLVLFHRDSNQEVTSCRMSPIPLLDLLRSGQVVLRRIIGLQDIPAVTPREKAAIRSVKIKLGDSMARARPDPRGCPADEQSEGG
jgi:hypothetical protein